MDLHNSKKSIMLMGLKHSGKTTLGRRLAVSRGMPFRDLDDLLLVPAKEEWQKRGLDQRLSCRNLYRYSPELFREMEEKGAEIAVKEMVHTPVTLALGGGVMENLSAMEILAPHGIIVYLEEDPAVLYERIVRGGIPPFFDTGDPWKSFLDIYQRRALLCSRWADITINLKGALLGKAWELLDQQLA